MVHSTELTAAAITNAILKGDFYSSTGVKINSIKVDSGKIDLQLSNKEGWGFKTFFISKNGSISKIDESENPSYTLAFTDIYVRCGVERSMVHRMDTTFFSKVFVMLLWFASIISFLQFSFLSIAEPLLVA